MLWQLLDQRDNDETWQTPPLLHPTSALTKSKLVGRQDLSEARSSDGKVGMLASGQKRFFVPVLLGLITNLLATAVLT